MRKCSKCGQIKDINEFYLSDKGHHCKQCKRDYANKWGKSNKERKYRSNRKASDKVKKEIIDYYGGKCACCGEDNFLFLTIDHINGGGRKHRKEINRNAGRDFYFWLRLNNFPEGFQVLCYNCNCGKHVNNGICPHKI